MSSDQYSGGAGGWNHICILIESRLLHKGERVDILLNLIPVYCLRKPVLDKIFNAACLLYILKMCLEGIFKCTTNCGRSQGLSITLLDSTKETASGYVFPTKSSLHGFMSVSGKRWWCLNTLSIFAVSPHRSIHKYPRWLCLTLSMQQPLN